MNDAIDIAALRHDYVAHGLRRADLDADPVKQFSKWFAEAAAAEIRDVNAMNLATIAADGRPDARVVLLKAISDRGFVFFTNYSSAKARQLAAIPQAALTFYWVQLERQIRVRGRAEKTSPAESEEYFRSRPLGSRLGAWASRQSEVIANRAVLEAQLAEITARFADGEVPLPEEWGGYRVVPDEIEFWQGRANRLHDRFRYRRESDGAWVIERLSP